jgi:NAD(P)-dependent dehydrogenase (short-subunit alcohol dehydrogenase family)
LVDADERSLEAATQGLDRAATVVCDVSRADEVGRLQEAVEQRLGAPWLLVNALVGAQFIAQALGWIQRIGDGSR